MYIDPLLREGLITYLESVLSSGVKIQPQLEHMTRFLSREPSSTTSGVSNEVVTMVATDEAFNVDDGLSVRAGVPAVLHPSAHARAIVTLFNDISVAYNFSPVLTLNTAFNVDEELQVAPWTASGDSSSTIQLGDQLAMWNLTVKEFTKEFTVLKAVTAFNTLPSVSEFYLPSSLDGITILDKGGTSIYPKSSSKGQKIFLSADGSPVIPRFFFGSRTSDRSIFAGFLKGKISLGDDTTYVLHEPTAICSLKEDGQTTLLDRGGTDFILLL